MRRLELLSATGEREREIERGSISDHGNDKDPEEEMEKRLILFRTEREREHVY